MKQKYYDGTSVVETDSEYNVLFGERSNGKSYFVKEYCLTEYLEKGLKFIYLRRLDTEIKPRDIEGYFSDTPVRILTKKKYTFITSYRKALYLANLDENGKVVRGPMIGCALSLNSQVHYKSQAYVDYGNLIFEEFATKKGYLPDEPGELLELVSTVFRRRRGRVWLIGNTVTRVCPYYTDWGLVNIPKQKQGTIDIYKFKTKQLDDNGIPITIQIAVNYCENSGSNSKMFFGKKEKSITGGSWECDEHPNIASIDSYTVAYEILLESYGFRFILQLCSDDDTGGMFVYVYPATTKRKIERIICDDFSANPYITSGFLPTEKIFLDCIHSNKLCFSDNLTGEDFKVILKERKWKL